jgi:hypothetical protein
VPLVFRSSKRKKITVLKVNFFYGNPTSDVRMGRKNGYLKKILFLYEREK